MHGQRAIDVRILEALPLLYYNKNMPCEKRIIMYIYQNSVVLVIIIDQWNQTARFYEIQIHFIFIAALVLSLWRKIAFDRGLPGKPGLGHLEHWQTVQTQIRRLRLNETVLSPSSEPFF